MNGRDDRGPWYLLTGLVLGVIVGLGFAWGAQPVKYTDTAPASLRADFKDEYRALIAAAYLGNEDLTRARARLELLEDEDMLRALIEQAQRTLAENGSNRQAQALGVLAIALGQSPPGPGQVVTQPGAAPVRPASVSPSPETGEAPATDTQPSATPAPATNTPTSPPATRRATLEVTPDSDATDLPTATAGAATPIPASPTSASPFILLSQEKLCEETLSAPVFRIEALDRFNNPMSGVLVIVSWSEGEERFYTGLKPEKGAGYADFDPESGVLYSVRLGESGTPVTDLAAVMCPRTSGAPTWAAWMLKFVQP